jgi:serine protease
MIQKIIGSKWLCFGVIMALGIAMKPINSIATDYEPGVLIVKTKASRSLKLASASNTETINKKYNIKKISKINFPSNKIKLLSATSIYRYELEEKEDLEKLAKEFEEQDWVEYAEPNYYVYAAQAPNDPHYHKQDYIKNTQLFKLLEWTGSEDILVAVLDSGIDYLHEDLAESIYMNSNESQNNIDDDKNGFVDDVKGYNFNGFSNGIYNQDTMDYFGHGTHIAGIIGAKRDNHVGIIGLNAFIKILNVKFLDSSGRGSQLDAAAAIRYSADMGVKVINCSWGYYKYTSVMKEAIEYALSKGAIVVAAAGNSSSILIEYPAGFEGVLSVASVDLSFRRSSFSSIGSHIDFSAFGQTIYSTLPNNNYGYKSGTSQSAAVLTGIISRILACKPELTPDLVEQILIQSSNDLYESGKDRYTGYGVIDINKLGDILEQEKIDVITNYPIDTLSTSAEISLSNVLNFPNPFGTEGTRFSFTSSGGEIQIRVFNSRGKLVKTINETISAGTQATSNWDGYDESGEILDNGTYFYIVTLTSGTKKKHIKGKLTVLH